MTPERFDEIERVCQAALDLPPEKRGAFLEQACAGDPDLRAEVDELLDGASRAESLLDERDVAARAPVLAAGQRLGPYEIQQTIGAGGMGEVYQARDTRLDREVAIKILPPDVSGDPVRRARFEREAKTIAGLNHPHICTLHDIGREKPVLGLGADTPRPGQAARGGQETGQAEPLDFLVMELLAGETLAARLEKGRLPLDQALTIGTEIAEALAAAHRQGIVHRDLKPANVMLTKSGAKLLDFGLAKVKANGGQTAVPPLAAAPKTTLTAEAAIVGTLPYMAPEQLEGKTADARTDLWALGAILYEMVAGKRAFEGDSQASIITAIMSSRPPAVSSLQPLTPPALESLVQTCLQRDPESRWQSASDVAAELRWLARDEGRVTGPAGVARPTRPWRRPLRAATGLAVLAAAVAAGYLAKGRPIPSAPAAVQHVSLSLSEEGIQSPTSVGISPDGRTVAFSARGSDGRRVYLRPLGARRSREVTGTRSTRTPRFSPDGEWIAFQSGPGLSRALVAGGPAAPFELDKEVDGFAWAPDGGFVFANFTDLSLSRVRADGVVETLFPIAQSREGVARPTWLDLVPGGDVVLFNVVKARQPTVWAYSIGRRTGRQLPVVGLQPRYLAATGHLVYASQGQLFAVPYNPEVDPFQVNAAAARPVIDGLGTPGSGPGSGQVWDVSANGTLVYLGPFENRLALTDRRGRATVLPLQLETVDFLVVSPDGRRAVVTTAEGAAHRLYSVTLQPQASMTRLTQGDDDWYGAFTPDGRQVLYTAASAGTWNIWATAADGSGRPRAITEGRNPKQASSVRSPRDTFLYFELHDNEGDIWERELGRPDTARQIVATPKFEGQAVYSPDGRWIAYYATYDERAGYEVYVKGYPDGPRQAVSVGGGRDPVWNPKGGELLYGNLGNTSLMAVRVVDGARVGQPTELFSMQNAGAHRIWDVMPDGEHFLVGEATRPPQINIVLNWFDELRAKVPRR